MFSFQKGAFMSDKKKLFVDLDGTLAEFRRISSDEELLADGYYFNLRPMSQVIDMVKDIAVNNKDDVDVYILSAYLTESRTAYFDKLRWCKKYIPEIEPNHIVLLPCGLNKAEYIKETLPNVDHFGSFYLLDDYTKNLNQWHEAGGIGIKLVNGINDTHKTWQGLRVYEPEFYWDRLDTSYEEQLNNLKEFLGIEIEREVFNPEEYKEELESMGDEEINYEDLIDDLYESDYDAFEGQMVFEDQELDDDYGL